MSLWIVLANLTQTCYKYVIKSAFQLLSRLKRSVFGWFKQFVHVLFYQFMLHCSLRHVGWQESAVLLFTIGSKPWLMIQLNHWMNLHFVYSAFKRYWSHDASNCYFFQVSFSVCHKNIFENSPHTTAIAEFTWILKVI